MKITACSHRQAIVCVQRSNRLEVRYEIVRHLDVQSTRKLHSSGFGLKPVGIPFPSHALRNVTDSLEKIVQRCVLFA